MKNAPDPAPENETRLGDRVVERIYDVALDPLKYGELLDVWEELMGPERRRANAVGPMRVPWADLGTHLRRLADILDRTDSANTPDPQERALSEHKRVAAFCIGSDLVISRVNASAALSYDIAPGDNLRALPLETEDALALISIVRSEFAQASPQAPVLRLNLNQSGDEDGPRPILVRLRRITPSSGDSFVMAVTSDVQWPGGLDETLAQSFKLTGSEIEVLRELSRSLTPREIAERRGRSVETVRAQIKSLLSKTDTRSQGDLVRLALSSMDIAGDSGPDKNAPRLSEGGDTLETLAFKRVIRPGGRQVEYLVLGDPNGRPVMYLSGFLGFTRLPAAAEKEARKRGLRIIAPVRPGFGASTPLPPEAPRRASAAADMLAVADAEGAERFPVIVLEEDATYALAMHAQQATRLSGIIGVAATLPVTKPDHFEVMGKWHRFFYTAANFTPQLVPFLVRTGFAMARRGGKRRFLESVLERSPADRTLLRDPAMMEAIEVGTIVTMDRNFDAADAIAAEFDRSAAGPTPELVAALRGVMPIHVLHGPEDQRCPPDVLEDLASEFPWINVHRLESGGMLLIFKHWRVVLDLAESLLDRDTTQIG